MLATISTREFDPDGYVQIEATVASALGGERTRRVNRVTTLDGGVAINDFGYTDGDRTLDLRWTPASEAQERAVERLLRTYPTLCVTVPDGAFLAAPERYTPGTDESTLRLLVVSRLSE